MQGFSSTNFGLNDKIYPLDDSGLFPGRRVLHDCFLHFLPFSGVGHAQMWSHLKFINKRTKSLRNGDLWREKAIEGLLKETLMCHIIDDLGFPIVKYGGMFEGGDALTRPKSTKDVDFIFEIKSKAIKEIAPGKWGLIVDRSFASELLGSSMLFELFEGNVDALKIVCAWQNRRRGLRDEPRTKAHICWIHLHDDWGTKGWLFFHPPMLRSLAKLNVVDSGGWPQFIIPLERFSLEGLLVENLNQSLLVLEAMREYLRNPKRPFKSDFGLKLDKSVLFKLFLPIRDELLG